MNRLGNQQQQLPTLFPTPSSFLILSLAIALLAGCSSPGVGDQADLDATVSAAVEATVAVSVEATVAAQSGTSPTVAGMVESAAQGGDGADASGTTANADSGENEAAAVPELSEQELEVAQWVTSQTRHYIGDPNAPVVFIEFSDFQ